MGLDNPLHIAFLVVILLLVFGARRLPEIGRSLGSGLREFKQSLGGEPSQPTLPAGSEQPQPVGSEQPQPVGSEQPQQPVPAQQTASAQAEQQAPAPHEAFAQRDDG
jgi:sec-independent protein translocase protein TatA